MKNTQEIPDLSAENTPTEAKSPEELSLLQRFLSLDARFSAKLVVPEKPGPLRWLFILLGHSCDSWYWLIFLSCLLFFGSDAIRTRTLFWIFGMVGLR